MALVEKTIGAGGDYSTIQAWVDDCPGLGTDIWRGVITTTGVWDEEVDMDATGTASSTSYLWLDVDPSIRHDGVPRSGAYINNAGNLTANALITVNKDWTRISNIELELGSAAGASKEGIRVPRNTFNVLIEGCLIWTTDTTSDQDGIYLEALDDLSVSIVNTVITGFQRGGIHFQNYTGTSVGTINVDHCSLYDNGHEGDGGQLLNRIVNASSSATWNVYNTVMTNSANGTSSAMALDLSLSGTLTWNGSHNSYDLAPDAGTDNLTNKVALTDGITDVTQGSGAYWVVEEATTEPFDLRLLDDSAGNVVIDAGTDRQGSEPDSRSDFSSDAKGESRPTTGVDIGAFEYQIGGVSISGKNAATTETGNAGAVVQGGTNPPNTPSITTPTDTATVGSPVNIVFTYSDPDGDLQARVALKRTYVTIYP